MRMHQRLHFDRTTKVQQVITGKTLATAALFGLATALPACQTTPTAAAPDPAAHGNHQHATAPQGGGMPMMQGQKPMMMQNGMMMNNGGMMNNNGGMMKGNGGPMTGENAMPMHMGMGMGMMATTQPATQPTTQPAPPVETDHAGHH